VSPSEVLTAVTELRRIRDIEGAVKYVGISGYPVSVLRDLAELVLKETGEPLDCVMSYANFTLQNTRLETEGLKRLKAAGVDVVPNASILGMGLLRRDGAPVGAAGDWHPAPNGLRLACQAASDFCDSRGEKLEVVAIRWALETWLSVGGNIGSTSGLSCDVTKNPELFSGKGLGVSVIGVSNIEELDETMRIWWSILGGLEEKVIEADQWQSNTIQELTAGIWEVLGEWKDFAWASPGEDYMRVQMAA
jgi:D-arabinose 1-dehydrogenase